MDGGFGQTRDSGVEWSPTYRGATIGHGPSEGPTRPTRKPSVESWTMTILFDVEDGQGDKAKLDSPDSPVVFIQSDSS